MNKNKSIEWKQNHKIEISGYVDGEITFIINSFYNRNFAIPINKKYIGETWLNYKGIQFKLESVKDALEVAEIINTTGRPPKYLRGLYPRVWLNFDIWCSRLLKGKSLPKTLEEMGIKADFPIDITEQRYPSYRK